MKIGLISDVHASAAPLHEALALFRRRGVDRILCAGDVAGYGSELERTIALLVESDSDVVLGNHDLWWCREHAAPVPGAGVAYLNGLPAMTVLCVAGKTLCMVHASPRGYLLDGIRLLDDAAALIPRQQAFWSAYLSRCAVDVLVVGHTHQVFAEPLGGVLVINPGSTCFNNTCAILSLPEMTVEFLPLAGKTPVLSWNWGVQGLDGGRV